MRYLALFELTSLEIVFQKVLTELVEKVHTKLSYRNVLTELADKVHFQQMTFEEYGHVVLHYDGLVTIPRIIVPVRSNDVSDKDSMPGLLPPELVSNPVLQQSRCTSRTPNIILPLSDLGKGLPQCET